MASNHTSEPWSLDEVMQSTKDHVVYTWGATDPMRNASFPVKKGEGVYLIDYNDKKYYDMTS